MNCVLLNKKTLCGACTAAGCELCMRYTEKEEGMANYLAFESMTEGLESKVRQDLKFKTGNFLWKIKFNVPLDPKTVNNVNLYVTTVNMTPLKTAIRYNSLENEIEIEPLEPYAQNESYVLNITTKVTSLSGKPLKQPLQVQFKIDNV